MGQIIKVFSDGSFLEYDRGKFDDWCVYFTNTNGLRKPPRDVDYFEQLLHLSQKYGAEGIYSDYVKVYELTGKQVLESSLNSISIISEKYPEDVISVDIVFSILYMAMIAEEQKQYTRLGKRIKRLGIHMLLIEKSSVHEAANFMKGMGWREIAALCEKRGF
ncbi:MAG: hypothetical protein GX144_13400 [Clostridiaceae bacterium]|nr:hypothetical protein [Clostridiaceae bacterium]